MSVCPQCASECKVPARFCGECGASLPEVPGEIAGQAAKQDPKQDQKDPWIGRIVDKRYRVLSLIGSGGMGLVYRVEHIQLGKIAAMKVLHADTARDSDAVRRFRNEAQAVSRLSHPNIVQTFDFGQFDGSLYLIMEYVRGEDLAALVMKEGPLPFHRAAPLFVQICSALTDAHEAGVIHRDLKPENIVVVARRAGTAHAKVLDFGLAKLRERKDGAEITSRGQVIGTPYYMSPEQVRSEELDVRTDIYSLGATLYRVLTGTPPFQAPTPVGVLAMHITDPLELPRHRAPGLNLPAAADAIVARAMAKARDDRYATAAEVQHDLELAIDSLRQGGSEGTDQRRASPRPASAPVVAPVAVDESESASRSGAHLVEGSVPGQHGERKPPWRDSRDKTRKYEDVQKNEDGDENEDENEGGGGGEDGDARGWGKRIRRAESVDSGDRLRKQDFDAFERSLRRKKLTTSLIVPALLLCVGSLVIWGLGRNREKPSTVEREPNDNASEATLLPLDVSVEGTIGQRQAGGQPDMDYFRVPAGKGPRVVSARLEGLPGVDLVLELFDAQGVALSKIDAHGVGGGEWMQPVTIGPAEAYLLVRQVWIQGTGVMENVADPYRLSVHWGAPSPGWEVEPNDWRDRATVVQPGDAVKGYLGSAEDKDWFVFTPATSGYLVGRVTAPEGVEISVTVGDPSPTSGSGRAAKADRLGQLKIPAKAGTRTWIGLMRKLPPGTDAKLEALEGLDAPYELKFELRTAP